VLMRPDGFEPRGLRFGDRGLNGFAVVVFKRIHVFLANGKPGAAASVTLPRIGQVANFGGSRRASEE